MTFNQQNLLELAKPGNTRAITALINRSLSSKGNYCKSQSGGIPESCGQFD
ncbi:MAG: hypothetical protein ACFCVD_17285 [Nodosilinea sp.]